VSEPHIDELTVEFLSTYNYISRTSCRKSFPALILRAFLHHSLIQNFSPTTRSQREDTNRLSLDSNSKDGDHSWTYLFNG